MSALPAWLGSGRRSKLGAGERLVRLTDGPLAGQVAIECPSDDGARLVYTQTDWEADGPASLQFDRDGDLVWSTPDGGPSSRVVRCEMVVSRFVAVGNDGRRPVIWGVGDTEEEAVADALAQDEGPTDATFLFVHPCTPAIEERLQQGDVSWAQSGKPQER